MRAIGIALILGICLAGCKSNSPAAPLGARPADPCATVSVDVTVGQPRCGIAIARDGSVLVGSRHHPPIVLATVGPVADLPAPGFDVSAKSLHLSPPSPDGRFRLVGACWEETAAPDCGFRRLVDLARSDLIKIHGGSRWLGWSPEGRYAATFGGSIDIVDTKTGVTHHYPDEGERWFINDDSFAWVTEGSFVVTILRCNTCSVERYKFILPD